MVTWDTLILVKSMFVVVVLGREEGGVHHKGQNEREREREREAEEEEFLQCKRIKQNFTPYYKIMYSKIRFPGTNPVSSVRKSARLLTVWSWVRSPHRVFFFVFEGLLCSFGKWRAGNADFADFYAQSCSALVFGS